MERMTDEELLQHFYTCNCKGALREVESRHAEAVRDWLSRFVDRATANLLLPEVFASVPNMPTGTDLAGWLQLNATIIAGRYNRKAA